MSWAKDDLNLFYDELKVTTSANVIHLLSCGHHIFNSLLHSPSEHLLQSLLDTAYHEMSLAPSSICWPRLYTDVSIIQSLAYISISAIAQLDRAIIIAGAAGQGRLDLVLSLIRKLQSHFFPPFKFIPLSIPSSQIDTPILHLSTSSHDIPTIDPAPSFTSFQHRYPFLLRNNARSWPAINEHPWASAAYLRSVAGPARIVPVEVGADYRTDDWTQQFILWDEFLATLQFFDQPPTAQSNKVLYLAQHNLLMQFPDLSRDIIIPDYVYSCPPPPVDYPQYKPPGNDEQLVINAWLGPRGTISPAHTDPYYNLYVQVVGRKTVWLAPPSVTASMYAFESNANPASNKTNPSMSNTSRVDVFDDKNLYPQFWTDVVPEAMSITLTPGDMLFIPPGWWHAMRAEETSFSVSMWF